MVRIGWYFREDLIRVSKPVSNGNAFQASQKPSLLLRPHDLRGNGWSVLARVALAEDVERAGCRDGEVVIAEAALAVLELH